MSSCRPKCRQLVRDQSVEELRRELAEAREQQAATAQILAAISSSPTDPHRVFAEIAESAARLCDGYSTGIFQLDGDHLRLVAHHGPITAVGPIGQGTLPLIRGLPPARAVLDRQTSFMSPTCRPRLREYPEGSDFARRLGFRAALAVPLMRANEAIGVITIRRTDARPFTDRQIELLKTFADQAVIAIENTRLFEEVQEKNHALTEAHAQVSGALERETATSEILRVIGSSPTDVHPVFETIARSGVSVCGALGCVVLVVDGGMIRLAATHGVRPERLERFRHEYPLPLSAEIDTAQTIRSRRMFHLADIENNPNATSIDIENARLAGYRTRLMVPMVRGDRTLGLIAVTREDPAPFPDQLVELLRTFADQAVIAIENTRLFEAEQARTRELTRVAGAADGDVGNPASHQQFAQRHAAGVRRHRAERVEALSGRPRQRRAQVWGRDQRRGRRRAGSGSRRSLATHNFPYPPRAGLHARRSLA